VLNLRERERVYLLKQTKDQKNFNLKSKQPSNKLDAIKYGLFMIKKKLSNNNYKLKLPE